MEANVKPGTRCECRDRECLAHNTDERMDAIKRIGYKAGREGKNPAFTPHESEAYTIGWLNGVADRNEAELAGGDSCPNTPTQMVNIVVREERIIPMPLHPDGVVRYSKRVPMCASCAAYHEAKAAPNA